MNYSEPARTAARRSPGGMVGGVLVVVAAITAALGYQILAPSSSTASPPINAPAVGHLDPDLFQALHEAKTDAADDGVEIHVNSGWRSPEHQNHLLREAKARYGSEAEAARWVATADTSPHVSGDAIDVGPSAATAWLSDHGARYGLCQIYGNEPWHFELRTEAVDHGCPSMYADPTHDPRMQR